jgi:IS1 family transposase
MIHLIQALIEKPRTKQQLEDILKVDFPELTDDARRKRVERFVDKFGELGLIEEREDKYCWYVYFDLFKNYECYSAKHLHSRNLIPALKRIAVIDFPGHSNRTTAECESVANSAIAEECAKDHLRTYAQLWKTYEKYTRTRDRMDEETERLKSTLATKLERETNRKAIDPSRGLNLKGFVGNNIPLLVYSEIMHNYSSRIEKKRGNELWIGECLAAKGARLSRLARSFFEREVSNESNIQAINGISKIENETFKILQDFQTEIRKLVMKIESGEPLIGKCSTCPKVYLAQAEK